MDSNMIIIGDINILLALMDGSSRWKISKKISALNDMLEQMYLTDIYRIFHPKAAEYTFFSSACGTFSKIEHMLSHKTSLNLREMKSYQASFLTTVV